jgi:hypothetical protein
MRALVFTPDRNTHGNDYTGAFQPEAEHFVKLNGVRPEDVHRIDVSKTLGERRAQLMQVLQHAAASIPLVNTLAFFCHGWSRGIQLGLTTSELASAAHAIAALSGVAPPLLRIALYACSTGADVVPGKAPVPDAPGGEGDFADRLRDALCVAGRPFCQVDAHTVRGHTTQNPFVRRFSGDGSPTGGQGGSWIVAPKSVQWRAWMLALQNTDLRFRFPFMSIAEVHSALQQPAEVV